MSSRVLQLGSLSKVVGVACGRKRCGLGYSNERSELARKSGNKCETGTNESEGMSSDQGSGQDSLVADACIVLNRPLPKGALDILECSKLILACDGGANHLMQAGVKKVDALIGDMDSVSDEAKEFFTSGGVSTLTATPSCNLVDLSDDQDTTDFEKAVTYFLNLQTSPKVPTTTSATTSTIDCVAMYETRPTIVVLGALQGRLDHVLQQLNICYRFVDKARLVLVSDDSFAEVLPPVPISLKIDATQEGPTCGLVPFNQAVKGSTTGLVWNLEPTEKLKLEWGGLISTSNSVQEGSSVVTFNMQAPVLWTIERKE
eukprot:m.54984 g.54984  ORF g.54984 m.54984 type:complete len:316 (+) comp7734_c6_seq1:100-1047(+)